ncbi:MAG: insulinase family protein [Bacteroidetes bacterium]|nr:insulinase family protein [Bacteroidota bacterium]
MNFQRMVLLITLLLLLGGSLEAQIDRSKKPEPGPAPTASFPDYHESTLDNGLRVFVISNHAQPLVTFRLLIRSGSEYDGEISGIADNVTQLLTAGTTSRDKLTFAKEADLLGLSIGAGAADDQMSVSGSGLKKHMDQLLTLMTDALYNPVFPEDELDKLKKQSISGLQTVKRDPDQVMGRLQIVTGYAPHPYANFGIEEDVEKTTRTMLVDFHNQYFIPNNASLAVVGDVTPEEILPVIRRYFSSWKEGKPPVNDFPRPEEITGRSVHLVDLGKTQTQTAISVLADGMNRRNPDYLSASLMNSILGGGFSGRLFANLRETYGFTYGAYSDLEARKHAGLWMASSTVRRSATDSAFTQILLEMDRMRYEPVDEATMDMHRQYAAGRFLLGLESPSNIAAMVQNIDLYDLPKDYYRNYVANIMRINAQDVQHMAEKYLDTDNVALLAVGDAGEILDPLKAFGEVHMYDTDINPVSEQLTLDIDIDAPTLMENHIEAIGGRARFEELTTRITKGEVVMSFGPVQADGSMLEIEKAPNKKYQHLTLAVDMGGGPQTMETEQWIDGENVFMRQPMQPIQEVTGEEREQTLENEQFNPLIRWKELGFDPTVTAKREMDGRVVYVVELKRKHSTQELFFDAESMLLVARSETGEGPQGPVTTMTYLDDYRETDGMMLPYSIRVENPQMSMKATINSYEHNVDVEDERFEVPQK